MCKVLIRPEVVAALAVLAAPAALGAVTLLRAAGLL